MGLGLGSSGARRGRRHCARGAHCSYGREANIKTTTKILKKTPKTRPLQKGAHHSGLWVLGRWPKRFPCPPPGTKGMGQARNCGTVRHRCVFLNATVAHSWPLQLLGSERIFSSILRPSPSLRVSSGHGIICFSSSKDIPFP